MQKIRLIIHHLKRNQSQREIAKQLAISRNTVKTYIKRLESSGMSWHDLHKLDDSALAKIAYPAEEVATMEHMPRLYEFTRRVPDMLEDLKRTGVTRKLLWEEYLKVVPNGYQYPQFCKNLSNEKSFLNATMHFEYEPGDLLLIDFAGDHMGYVDKSTGEIIQCPVLVCVLPFSGYSYVIALPNASLPQVIKALNLCLEFFGCAPMNLKSDNMKQIVYKSCRYEPVFTETMEQWALHNNITLKASRVRKPKDKAPVESEVKLAYQRIYAPLRDEVFYSIEELNMNILIKLAEHHQRSFQKKSGNRITTFNESEKQHMQSLAHEPFTVKHYVEAKVQKNYHIILGEDWHQYSVAYTNIGRKVQAVYDADTVEIYYRNERITSHKRSYKKHGYTTLAEHMPEGHRPYIEQKGWNADYFLAQAGKVGTHCRQFVYQVLQSKKFTEQTYNGCLGILSLIKTYGAVRMEAACKRALNGRSMSYRIVKNILVAGLDKLEYEKQPDLFTPPSHENVRGAEAYQ
ncbi:MAG: IS21 family transposase [Candidatus Saccharimonadaceae bacterium]